MGKQGFLHIHLHYLLANGPLLWPRLAETGTRPCCLVTSRVADVGLGRTVYFPILSSLTQTPDESPAEKLGLSRSGWRAPRSLSLLNAQVKPLLLVQGQQALPMDSHLRGYVSHDRFLSNCFPSTLQLHFHFPTSRPVERHVTGGSQTQTMNQLSFKIMLSIPNL